MKNWLSQHIFSIIATVIISIILLIFYLVFLQPNNPSNYLPFIILNLISPWIIFLFTQIFSLDRVAKNYVKPDFDIIPIFNPLYSFMLQEKRYAIKINVFDDYVDELNKNSVLWLYEDLGSDKIAAAYSIFKHSKNKLCIWINLNNRNVKLTFLCLNIYNNIKYHIKTDLLEETIKANPLKVFDILNDNKDKFLIIFDNFREIEFDDIDYDLITVFDGMIKEIIGKNNNILFLTQSMHNAILSSSSVITSTHSLNRLRDNKLLKSYLKTFKVSISNENIQRLVTITNCDTSSINIFIDIYLDLKKRFNIKNLDVVEILSLLNNNDLFNDYFEKKIVSKLTVSEIESLEFISVFEMQEQLSFINDILHNNNLISYDFIDSVSKLEDKRLIYSANMIKLFKIFGLNFMIKIKNHLYRRYFATKISQQKNKVYLQLNEYISLAYLNTLNSNIYNVELYKGLFHYSLLSKNYRRCIEIINLYDRSKIYSIINIENVIPRQDIYEFIKERIDIIPLEELIPNEIVLLTSIKIHISYEYYLWGINEEENIEYCFQTIDKLYKENSQNPIVLLKYPVVVMAYYRFKEIAFDNLDEIEFSLNNLFKQYIKVLNKDDLAFYQLLLAKVYYLRNKSYQYNQLIVSAEKNALSPAVKGQILFEKAKIALDENNIKQSLRFYDESLKYLSSAKYYHIIVNASTIAIEVASLHNLFNYLEKFNKYLTDAMLYKFYEQNDREILFTRIFQNYNFNHHSICIPLCAEYLHKYENDSLEDAFKQVLNIYIILFDSFLIEGKYNEMKKFYSDILSKIAKTYFIHLINNKYLHFIDEHIGENNWINEGVKICEMFPEQPYYILKLANYLRVSNRINDAILVLEKISSNSNVFEEYRQNANGLLDELKAIIGGS